MTSDALYDLVTDRYADHVNPGLARLMSFAGFGVEVSAKGCEVTDHEGRVYLDFLGGYGVFSLGHSHPGVIAAVQAQLQQMALSSKVFFNPRLAELAARLAAIAPEGLDYTFLSNSGAEAVEAALKFARIATGRTETIATHGGYHGKTLGALSVTGRDKYRLPVEPLMPGARFVPFGDAEAVAEVIGENTAAVIVEVIQGEGGIHIAPPDYLARLRELCDRHGALLIVDEVQTGLGRTGAMFACLAEGVKPDLMTLAKALGGGIMPIGATMGTAEVWSSVFAKNPLIHTSTFGGNPLACAAAIAALDAIENENLCQRSLERGDQLMAGLRNIKSDLVAEVRGRGLMVGIEFRMDDVGELIIGQLTKRGIIAAYTLNNPRVIRMEPPLIVSADEIDRAVSAMAGAIEETESLLAGLPAMG